MKGAELVRRIQKLGKRSNVVIKIIKWRGKGSHRALYFGDRFAIIPKLKSELKTGAFHGILDQLGIKPNDLR